MNQLKLKINFPNSWNSTAADSIATVPLTAWIMNQVHGCSRSVKEIRFFPRLRQARQKRRFIYAEFLPNYPCFSSHFLPRRKKMMLKTAKEKMTRNQKCQNVFFPYITIAASVLPIEMCDSLAGKWFYWHFMLLLATVVLIWKKKKRQNSPMHQEKKAECGWGKNTLYIWSITLEPLVVDC